MKAVLVKGAKISFTIDKDLIHDTTPNHVEFYYPNGIIDLMKESFEKRKKIISKFFYANLDLNSKEKSEIYIAFNEGQQSSMESFCNTIRTPDGGSHENALKNSVMKALKLYGKKNQISKSLNIATNDLFDFSDSFISIFINSPSFEGQTKKRIMMPKIQKQLEEKIQNQFLLWLNSNKKESTKLLEALIERSLMRTELTKFKELTNCPIIANTSFYVRGKPIVCTPEDTFRCFMVTGLDLLVIGNCI